ncbi:MAG: serine--tRNA ligase [Pseudomonadota bacterium]
MKRRGIDAPSPAILKLDEERRSIQTELQDVQNERNTKSKEIGKIKGQGGDAQSLMDEVAALKNQMAEMEARERTLGESLNQHLSGLPNIMADDVPDGADEDQNVEVHKWGEPRDPSDVPEHFEIGEALGMMDSETAVKMSGSRFTLLSGGLARMERALAQFFLDTHTSEHGYSEMSPPLLVRDNALYGTGQLPKFAEDLFKTSGLDYKKIEYVITESMKHLVLGEIPKPGDENFEEFNEDFRKKFLEISEQVQGTSHWLIPTSEVSLTNIVAEDIVAEDTLPRRYTAFTPCFRSEAGSAGKDTRGMIRQHQFYKVELVSITKPEDSWDEHERMTKCARTILEKLELPYRQVVLCSGDTGFGAKKTYDLEVWLPGQGAYREISSCSNCGDFQARRMNARFKRDGDPSSPKGSAGQGKKNEFVHTLNGSGVAVGRALIAVMENYYDPADGGIVVPDVLKPYMGGIEKITKDGASASKAA